jgi:hypothetical protein
MPGRTSVFLTVYLWSNVSNPADDYDGSDSYDYPYPNTEWNPSELGLYILPPNLQVVVGAGASPRFACARVNNIARCNVPFPEYGGYLYIGIATTPHYVLPNDVGFAYVQMLMVNGLGFDNTFSEVPEIGQPNCVMLNISVGTPHDPACNLAWDSAVPALGSDAYSYAVASTVTSMFVMGGLSIGAIAFFFRTETGAGILKRLQTGGAAREVAQDGIRAVRGSDRAVTIDLSGLDAGLFREADGAIGVDDLVGDGMEPQVLHHPSN